MLFQNIAALVAKGVKLNIEVVAADNGKLEVNVLPTSETGKSGFSLVAKSFVATPQELDADFAEVIAGFAAANLTLKEQLAHAETMAADIAKLATAAAAATRPASKPVSSTPAKRKGPELSDDDEDDDLASTPQATAATAEPAPFML